MGPLMLLIAIFIALPLTKKYSKLSPIKLNKINLFFFILGPCAIISYMLGHLGFMIGLRINEFIHNQKLIFDFRTYSLFFMGSVFLIGGLYMLFKAKSYISGNYDAIKGFCIVGILIILHSLPALVLNPLAIVPLISFIISIAAFSFIRKRVNLYYPTSNSYI